MLKKVVCKFYERMLSETEGKTMRIIAVLKKCSDYEKNLILSFVEKEDKVLFFDNEEEFCKSEEYENVEIIFGEPGLSTLAPMKKLRWIQMTWAGANKYTSAPDFPAHVVLTGASGAYGCVISEYIISGILALMKNLFAYGQQMKTVAGTELKVMIP